MARHSLTFNDELEKKIEDWQAKQRPIPSYTEAVETLLNEALSK
jgi:hypothetical protein